MWCRYDVSNAGDAAKITKMHSRIDEMTRLGVSSERVRYSEKPRDVASCSQARTLKMVRSLECIVMGSARRLL